MRSQSNNTDRERKKKLMAVMAVERTVSMAVWFAYEVKKRQTNLPFRKHVA